MEAVIVDGIKYSLLEDRTVMEEVVNLYEEVFEAEEPVSRWFLDNGVSFDEWCLQAYRTDLIKKLTEGHSIIATDPSTGKVVGARLSFRLNE